jgi:hypothetical protein
LSANTRPAPIIITFIFAYRLLSTLKVMIFSPGWQTSASGCCFHRPYLIRARKALIVVSALGGRLQKSFVHIFLSHIFLFRFCQQENVGQENIER